MLRAYLPPFPWGGCHWMKRDFREWQPELAWHQPAVLRKPLARAEE